MIISDKFNFPTGTKKAKRYVIPDIHGCYNTFLTLIEQIHLRKNDQLFLLGDYIDRGPESVRVVDFIIDLQRKKYQVFPLRGNHEHELVLMEQYELNNLISRHISKQNILEFYKHDATLRKRYYDFFNSLPFFIEIEDFIFVHAGFDFENELPFENTNAMLEIRNWPYNQILAKNKTIVHGHNPFDLDIITGKINSREKIVPLDNGCVYSRYNGMGNLLCLELTSFELKIQKNIDMI